MIRTLRVRSGGPVTVVNVDRETPMDRQWIVELLDEDGDVEKSERILAHSWERARTVAASLPGWGGDPLASRIRCVLER